MFLRVGTQFLQWSIQQGSIRSRNGSGRGAIAGQAIGRNTGATLIGAAVGTMVGYIVGNEMDKYGSRQLGLVYERGISGESTSWRNPDSGHMHSVTPRGGGADRGWNLSNCEN